MKETIKPQYTDLAGEIVTAVLFREELKDLQHKKAIAAAGSPGKI